MFISFSVCTDKEKWRKVHERTSFEISAISVVVPVHWHYHQSSNKDYNQNQQKKRKVLPHQNHFVTRILVIRTPFLREGLGFLSLSVVMWPPLAPFAYPFRAIVWDIISWLISIMNESKCHLLYEMMMVVLLVTERRWWCDRCFCCCQHKCGRYCHPYKFDGRRPDALQ
jgi:hypothetical protein